MTLHSIAIDGPSGAGKAPWPRPWPPSWGFCMWIPGPSTARWASMWPARGDCADPRQVLPRLPEIQIALRHGEDGLQHMFLGEEDVTRAIRANEVSAMPPRSRPTPQVRAFLLEMQRDFAQKYNVIMDGRDIGTVVLPQADLKIFLTASVEKRAVRRHKELAETGEAPSLETIREQIAQRDWADTHRETAPCARRRTRWWWTPPR